MKTEPGGAARGPVVADELARLHERVDSRRRKFAERLQQFGRVVAQVGFARGRVPLLLERLQRVEDAGVEPGRRVVGKAQVDGDPVGGLESDPFDLPGHAVGLRQEHGPGLRSVAVHELHALRRRDAVGLEEDVDLAQHALLLPGALDRRRPLGADPRDAAQAGGLLAEHAKRVRAERVDDLVRVDPADARHEAAAQVFADAVDGGRQLGGEGLDLELVAVLAMPGPPAAQVQGLPALDAREGADDGHLSVRVLAAELGDRVMGLLVEEDDAFEDALERIRR